MKKTIATIFIILLFITSNAFAFTNNDLLKVSEIEGTKFSCLYYPTTTKLGQLNASGEYTILNIDKRLTKFKNNRILNRKKYLSTINPLSKKIYYKKFLKFKNAYLQTKTCKNYKTAKISCEVYTANEPKVKVLNGEICEPLTSIVAKLSFKFSNDDKTYLCTGTLIAPNAFLTASHCLSNNDHSEIQQIVISFLGSTYNASSWHANPSYDSNNQDNPEKGDIALIFINKDLSATPFPLVGKSYTANNGKIGAMIGYGISDWNPTTTSFSGGFASINNVTNTGIYVQYNSAFGGSNTCSGDSGGPLAVYVEGTWKLFGVTSWGDDQFCGYNAGKNSWWSRINSEENIEFLETYLPNIFE